MFAAAAPLAATLRRAAAEFLAAVAQEAVDRWRAARAAAHLRSLPDHLLADIGLTRDRIDRAVLDGRVR